MVFHWKAKWLSEEALQIAEKRREAKVKGEKGRYTHLNAEFQRIARRDKKAFLTEYFALFTMQKKRKTIECDRRDLFTKLEIPREHFTQRWAQ